MNRRDFLINLGIGGAAFAAIPLLSHFITSDGLVADWEVHSKFGFQWLNAGVYKKKNLNGPCEGFILRRYWTPKRDDLWSDNRLHERFKGYIQDNVLYLNALVDLRANDAVVISMGEEGKKTRNTAIITHKL